MPFNWREAFTYCQEVGQESAARKLCDALETEKELAGN